MDIISKDFNRPLSEGEKALISATFPSAEPDKMKFLGEGGELVETSETTHPICNIFSCIDKNSFVKVYHSSNNSYAGLAEQSLKILYVNYLNIVVRILMSSMQLITV